MQKIPATTAVTKLMIGRTIATTGPKNALVTRIESAPVSGAVIKNDMHDDRDAPLRRISATTGTTEQLHSGIGTPMPALVATDFRLSSRNQRRMVCRGMNTWITPDRNSPRSSMGASSRKDDHRKSRNAADEVTLTASPRRLRRSNLRLRRPPARASKFAHVPHSAEHQSRAAMRGFAPRTLPQLDEYDNV